MVIKTTIWMLGVCGFFVVESLYAEMGCSVTHQGKDEEGCSISSGLLYDTSSKTLSTHNQSRKIPITQELVEVSVEHQKQALIIERTMSDDNKSCPPFCIQPLVIQGVKNVAELEVLMFIESFKDKKSQLLVDVRSAQSYKKSTIPGATNIPFSMLSGESPYRERILSLLGGKKSSQKWYFKNPQTLLIFSHDAADFRASKTIKILLELGYPANKLLYYREGVESWKRLGLTLF